MNLRVKEQLDAPAANAPPVHDEPPTSADAVDPPETAGPTNAGNVIQAFAQMSQVWSDFRKLGISPPPTSFAGIHVTRPAEVLSPVSDEEDAGQGTASSPGIEVALIRNILRKLLQNRSTAGPESDPGEIGEIDASA